MSAPKIKANEIQNSIRTILLEDWNPVSDSKVPTDEYDGYIGGVYRLLTSNPSEDEIIDYLCDVEKKSFGFSPERSKLLSVAKKLKALNIKL
ncbi:MAG: hypothetical protein ABIQ35_13665 [Verrucomicrobiota bacterium]